ncbi:leucine zipper domain-containing protein [Streptomyces sp. NBC_00667]|uniref:leucine zipper domain-containing protein n=1 Tax=unclassified Streptomyces TaxID=2593676 RepID=UPI003FA7DF20
MNAAAESRSATSRGHRNAPLTPEGRLRLCLRIDAGRPIAHCGARISRRCRAKWYARWRAHGEDGLLDHSSRPATAPPAPPMTSPTWWRRCGGRPSTGQPGSPPTYSGCTTSHSRPRPSTACW